MSKYINALNAFGDCKFCKKRDTCTERRGKHTFCWEIDEKFTANVIEIPESGIEDISDGYHTFRDLYYQRMVLFATIVKQNKELAWKSLRHEDGELCFDGDWFIVGIDTPEGSYTYHYEMNFWSMFDCQELERGKHWDGHTDKDVTRLLYLISKEVKHGKWMDGKYFLWKAKDKSAKGFHTATCSNCNITQSVMVYQGKIKYNFCPNCGADMRGKTE